MLLQLGENKGRPSTQPRGRSSNGTHSSRPHASAGSQLQSRISGHHHHHHHGSLDTLPTYSSQLTMASLATLESAVEGDEEEEEEGGGGGGFPPVLVRRGGSVGRRESDLELSQRTWSAYESLPGDVPISLQSQQQLVGEGVNSFHSAPEDIDTIDNDAYTTTQEIDSLSRNMRHHAINNNRTPVLIRPLQRVSTISNTSTGSGYVINSLDSPTDPHGPGRERLSSCYSTSSEGYVIDSLEWADSSRQGQLPQQLAPPRQTLPTIAENSVQLDYLQIIC